MCGPSTITSCWLALCLHDMIPDVGWQADSSHTRLIVERGLILVDALLIILMLDLQPIASSLEVSPDTYKSVKARLWPWLSG